MHDGDGAQWLPILSEWQERRLPLLYAMRDGFAAAGIEARVDTLGTVPYTLTMLRAWCPGSGIERAEQWLMRQIKPFDDAGADWASGVFCLLHQRWREFPLLSGTRGEVEKIYRRIEARQPSSPRWFVGARFGTVGADRCGLFTYARPATEVVCCLPNVRTVGGDIHDDPRQWLAIEVGHTEPDVAQLVSLGDGLARAGLETRRYEWLGGKSVLLTIHAGESSADELETRIAAALGDPWPTWAGSYRPWSWSSGVWLHRHAGPEGWRLRQWLEGELGCPVVDAREFPPGEVVIMVPAKFVDLALEALARRPGKF